MKDSKNVYSYKGLLLFFFLTFFSSMLWAKKDSCEGFEAEVVLLVCSPEEGNANGNVAIQVTGGTPFAPPADPYGTYDGNHVGNGIYEEDGLEPGTYTFKFWDKNDCSIEVTFTVSDDPCCEFKAEVLNAACSPQADNPNGNVVIQVSGGTPFEPSDPYGTYDANHVGNGIYEEDGLEPGTYTYKFWDKNDCSTEVTFTISDDPCCLFEAEVIGLTCSQAGNPNANVSIQVSGGSPFSSPADPYETSDGYYAGNGIYEEADLKPGTYTYSFADKNGCKAEVTFTVFEGPDAYIKSINGCSQVGDSDGNIVIQVKGGVPFSSPADPYETFGGNHVGNGIYEDEGLDPGTYTYTYTDSNGCSDDVTFTIPDVLTATNSGCEGTVEVSGGTPPYTSNFDGQQNNTGIFEFPEAPDGQELSFTDDNGCRVSVILVKPKLAYCDDFNFSVSQAGSSDFPWTSAVFASGVHANIGVTLRSNVVHNIVKVFKNGVEILSLEAGSDDCGPQNDCNGDPEANCDEFIVDYCDEITFRVEAGVCPDQSTTYILDVKCLEILGKSSQVPIEGPQSEMLTIFPNPTSDKFYIAQSKHELQTVRIMDVSGNVVKLENILGVENPQIDSSILTDGLYIIEILDTKGNVFIEKLLKK